MSKVYDLIIIGAGPAGLSAGLYGGRARVDTLVIEKAKDGGQIATTDEIENYPGGLEEDSGPALIARMTEQVKKFGAERVSDTITKVELQGDVKKVYGEKGEYHAKAVIIATGAVPRLLGVPGEKEYTGKGVSYCATCDAAFFEDFEVYVVGAGDSAVEEAMFITRYARKVTLLVRGGELTAAKSIQQKAFKNEKLDFLWNTQVTEIKGEDGMMSSIVIENSETKERREIFADEEDGVFGLFVFIGFIPLTGLFEGQVEMDRGYVIADDNMRTNIPGVYVAGDCRVKMLRQVVTACADGAIAATHAEKYLESLE
ncbi:MAG: thioredoxin-disulfide reductase [Defluviitaleaceae bacterium]|nr:thioredoxin-disulfide reductase [Defluviitaleaceae bacterium]